jgi:hypothetical protein
VPVVCLSLTLALSLSLSLSTSCLSLPSSLFCARFCSYTKSNLHLTPSPTCKCPYESTRTPVKKRTNALLGFLLLILTLS